MLFYPSSMSATGNFILSGSTQISGNYTVTLNFTGVDSLRYVAPNLHVMFISANSSLPAPILQSAKFSDSGGIIIVSFNSPTNEGGFGSCNNLTIDASASTGNGGRPWKSVVWSFTLLVTNFLGYSNFGSGQVTVIGNPNLPIVTVLVAKAMGYKRPTDIQRLCIPDIILGKDCIACAQTGSGKTVCFAFPILQQLSKDPFGIFAVVLTPTRELAMQIAQQFTVFGQPINIKVGLVIGGMNIIEQSLVLSKQPHIVIATPGRLRHHLLGPSPPNLSKARYLVLDECDRLLATGFQAELVCILSNMTYKKRQTLLFSATMTETLNEVEKLAMNETTVSCGQIGCVEVFSSGKSTTNIYNSLVKDESLHVTGSKEIFDRAIEGDQLAIEVIDKATYGGMAKAGENLLQPIRKHIDKLTWTVLETNVNLVTARSINHAGIIGAAYAALHAYEFK
eukprot:gene18563-24287_t